MKKCRRCTKPATMHITELREGLVQAVHLCESCAQEYLSSVDVTSSTVEPDEAFPESELDALEESEESSEQDDIACPHCGITFRQFRSQGRLGCPSDYSVFHDRLVGLLESIHSDTQHVGKFPRQAPDSSRRQFELIRLRNELRAAVEAESYEAAARLRDEIRTLEEKFGMPTSDENDEQESRLE